jgi:hypothetical protein
MGNAGRLSPGGRRCMPLAFGGAYGGAPRRSGPNRSASGHLSATPQPDEREHQADEAGAPTAPEAVGTCPPVPVKVRGLPPHPPWDCGARAGTRQERLRRPSDLRLLTEPRLDPGFAPIG